MPRLNISKVMRQSFAWLWHTQTHSFAQSMHNIRLSDIRVSAARVRRLSTRGYRLTAAGGHQTHASPCWQKKNVVVLCLWARFNTQFENQFKPHANWCPQIWEGGFGTRAISASHACLGTSSVVSCTITIYMIRPVRRPQRCHNIYLL